jgi:putative methyltransferase (TIGR04325 family)
MRTIVRLCLARTRIGGALGYVPLVRGVYARYALSRRHHPGIFSGVYASYDAALADIPSTRRAGWDNAEATSIWLEQPDPVAPSSYPLFFWLTQIARNDTTLLDYGGSIGLTYYGFQRRAVMPPGLRWVVVEVPRMAEQGRIAATRYSATCLEFVTDIAAAPPADILLSAGALQYMQHSVPGLLEMIAYRPRHIILNKLPLTAGDSYWTLQNFGPAVSPYRIFDKDKFMRYFETAGYAVRDEWPVTDLSCDIPFWPRHSVPRFTGMLLEHTAPGGAAAGRACDE